MMGSTSNEIEEYASILCLLHAKVHGDALPNDTPLVVHDCDLYGQKNPWELWELFGGAKDGSNGLYFFTVIRMNMSSLDVVRTIGSGSWQDQHIDAAIVCNDTNQQLAVKKCLLFNNSGTSHDGVWVLHEYRLVSLDFLGRPSPNFLAASSSANFSYVLCKMMKNEGNRVQMMRGADVRIGRQQIINRPRVSQSQSTTRLAQGSVAAAFNNNNSGGLRPMSENVQLQIKEEERRRHQA